MGRWKHSRAILKQASQYWEEMLVGDAAGTYKGHEVYQILGQSGKVMLVALRCITEGVLPYTGQLLPEQDLEICTCAQAAQLAGTWRLCGHARNIAYRMENFISQHLDFPVEVLLELCAGESRLWPKLTKKPEL